MTDKDQATPEGGRDERAAFEQSELGKRSNLEWDSHAKTYSIRSTADRFLGWQAHAALAASQQAAEPVAWTYPATLSKFEELQHTGQQYESLLYAKDRPGLIPLYRAAPLQQGEK